MTRRGEPFPDAPRIQLEEGTVLVALGQAVLDGRPFDARDEDAVARLAAGCGWTESVRSAEQVHGDRILRRGDSGPGDAFLLERGEAAVVRIADCWPVVVADPVVGRAVVAHCGWRGAAAGLAGASARALVAEGSRPGDLHAVCGPGISADSFEVGEEVARAFPSRFHARTRQGTLSVDLGAFLRADLENAGVPAWRIRTDSRDTMTDRSLHSFRRDGAHAGRMACLCIVREVV